MKQKMTIVNFDVHNPNDIPNLTLVAIHRGIQFTYVTDTDFYGCDDALVFLTDKFTLLGCIEEIQDYISMSYDNKNTIWNIVQCRGTEVEGEISLDFSISIVKNVSLFPHEKH